jgi:hypothetical protein
LSTLLPALELKKLYWLLVIASLIYWLSSCATEQRIPAAIDVRVDSALTAAGVPPLRKVKFTGPVTFQVGTGNVATTLAKAKGPVASAPGATASATKTGPPWWVYAGMVVLAVIGGFYARGRLKWPLSL